MDADDLVEVGYYEGPVERLLAALEAAGLDGAVVELDGDSDELNRLVDERTAAHAALAEANRRARKARFSLRPFVIKSRGGPVRMPIEGDNLAAVRALLDHHADPEIANELIVLDDEGFLVWAPDAGYNEIWVSRRMPSSSVEAFRAALGDGLRPSEPAG